MMIRCISDSIVGISLLNIRPSRSGILFVVLVTASIFPVSAQFATGGTTNGSSGSAPATTANGAGAIAVGGGGGANALAQKLGTIAIGEQSVAREENDIAVGKFAQTMAGAGAPAGGAALALGFQAKANAYGATALGSQATSFGRYSIAIGDATIGSSTYPSQQSIAIGHAAKAGLSLVGFSDANVANSIAIGTGSKSVFDAIALGGGSFAYGDHSIAIGINAKTGQETLPINNGVNGASAIAIGSNARALRAGSISLGVLADASGAQAIAIGEKAVAPTPFTVAIGTNANALAAPAAQAPTLTTVIGAYASTQGGRARDVAIGWQSITQPLVSTPQLTVNNTIYPLAGGKPSSTMSVGRPEVVGETDGPRTITNVGAGRVSSTSTDAVNGSQLDAVIKAFEAYVATHP